MAISFINQESKEIKNIDWRIHLHIISGKRMAAEFASVVLLSRLN